MTRKSKRYQLLIITLLLCFIQVAGIDVYAQEPVTPVQKDSTILQRQPPKARARRHHAPAQEQDSLKKDSIKLLKPERLQSVDSLSAAKIQVADSLKASNQIELKKKGQPEAILSTKTVFHECRILTKKYSYRIQPEPLGSL